MFFFLFLSDESFCQDTQIKGFIDVLSTYDNSNKKISFGFDEQDLFITSVINDRISFLGESVFKFTPSSPTEFSVSVERVIINFNIKGNNNLIHGKIHTPNKLLERHLSSWKTFLSHDLQAFII